MLLEEIFDNEFFLQNKKSKFAESIFLENSYVSLSHNL